MRQKYFRLKDMNEHMLKQLENGQQELDVLNSKIEGLQEVSRLLLLVKVEANKTKIDYSRQKRFQDKWSMFIVVRKQDILFLLNMQNHF